MCQPFHWFVRCPYSTCPAPFGVPVLFPVSHFCHQLKHVRAILNLKAAARAVASVAMLLERCASLPAVA
ncbi:hypothetical protein U0070_014810 [Myodes glareolus]|uniref:Secreted protein n=1 Tax=Myodes glareolus TaxID=447135 RepID=A0AAW0JEG1_MYOGA